ncbi:acyl-CoA dehydrogenase family protein [Peribacillus butanolivorans]|uniref:acyl-CoA dehydrogenase family protein n=1 Tax=Peribacillus butanolivorans TaxID=421767 RepID=UPI00207CADB1|nr:acyl-CoA dehydrogenase family protein [Peribacillus butanolivorans]MCO0601087.1 acyl-CoA dehydrogenase family protein [Peribacillus butanolivorans]
MDFHLTEELHQIRTVVRDFVEYEVEPYAKQSEEDRIPNPFSRKGQRVRIVWNQHSRRIRRNWSLYDGKGGLVGVVGAYA